MSLSDLLKSLFGRSKNAAEDEGQAEKTHTQAVPAFNRGMPIEVLKDSASPMLFGRLSSINSTQLIVERIPGEMSLPVFEPGSGVALRGYDMETNPIILHATVSRSSIVECVMDNWTVDNYANHRRSVRFPLTPSANIYSMEDKTLSSPEPCRLVNISTGGACILSTFSYKEGQELRLRLELIEKGGHTSYVGQVIRMSLRSDGSFEYGLLFVQLDKRKEGALLHDIETIQKDTEKKLLS